MAEAGFPEAAFKLSSFEASEVQLTDSLPSGRTPNGHVCQTPNLSLIAEERVVILSNPERYSEDGPAAPVLAEQRSLPMMVAEIGLWSGGVTAFVLVPFAIAAVIASPLFLRARCFQVAQDCEHFGVLAVAGGGFLPGCSIHLVG